MESVEKVKEQLSGSMYICIEKRAEASLVPKMRQRLRISRVGQVSRALEPPNRVPAAFGFRGNGAQRPARIGIVSQHDAQRWQNYDQG